MRRIGSALVVSVCVAVSGFAQQKPNFTGKWSVVSPAEAGPGLVQTVTHTETKLNMAHGAEGDEHSLEFILDGKEHRSTLPTHGSEIVTLYTATWKGDRHTIVSKSTYPSGKILDQTQVLSLDAKGQLIIDLTETFTGEPKTTMQIVHRKQ
jgi:hypothetical protein